ncbi:craniofacial development protein 2-like [Artemia franciscana]|uniref:craniofacial development protein 2-like n=1 Tax=Artemia franciscana TaxID=6661 RepID=UPI0032DA1C60
MTNARPRTGFLKTTECFRIGYWNVRTVNQETQPGKLNSVMRTLDKFRIDIAGLSETKLTGFGTLNSETYHILYSGLETKKEAGVGMALSSRAKKCLVDWEPINKRIFRARFATSQAKLTVIVVYAPTNDTVDQTKDDFYRVLSNVVAEAHRHDIVTLCGDFNAKVGSDASYAPAILGRHALGEINDNGVRLIEFCATHELIVGASWFPHKQIHKYTWNSPDGVTRNEIDHILISKHR